jgi:hypothetical protein
MKAILLDFFIEQCDVTKDNKVINVFHESSLQRALKKIDQLKIDSAGLLDDHGVIPHVYNLDMRVTATECCIITESIISEGRPELPF